MSLRAQINLLVAVLMLVLFVVLAGTEIHSARRSVSEEAEVATRITEQLLRNVVRVESATASPSESMRDFLSHGGRVLGHDLRLYDDGGRLLYQSPPSRYKSGRYAPAWFAQLVTPPQFSVEIDLPDGRLLMVPEHSRAVLDVWDEFVVLLVVALAFFVVINVIVFGFVGYSVRPLRDVVAALRQVEQGEFHTRLPTFRLPELAMIGETFNRMAQAIEDGIAIRRRAQETARELDDKRELNQLIQQHVEEERREMARELHDELGQFATAIKSIATSIKLRTKDRAPDLAAMADTIAETAAQIYDAMHRMVRRLRPMPLDNLGLGDALLQLVDDFRLAHPNLLIDLQLNGQLEGLGETINITVYRLIQEALSNVVHHSGAARAWVLVNRLAEPSGNLEINVRDDGGGLDVRSLTLEGHFGLRGMRERVAALKGRFTLIGDGGVTVSAVLPLRHEQSGQ
jgi:two-component system sensor histidine kinase UhpB